MCLLIPILLSLHLKPETVSVRNFPMGLGISTLQVVVLLQGRGWGGARGGYVVNLTGESTSLEDRL